MSIISGIQVLHALDKAKYNVIPVYLAKDGRWILGDSSFYKVETFKNLDKASSKGKSVIFSTDPSLKSLIIKPKTYTLFKSLLDEKEIDVIFPVFHGRFGEDGSIQGLFEMADIAYVGCGVVASSVGMDKVLSKQIARSINIPVLKDVWLLKKDWLKNKKTALQVVIDNLKFPVFVKPANLGSTIGITKAKNQKELADALDVAFFYDIKVLVEEGLADPKEINISVLGNNPYEVSACEEPLRSSEVLSYEDKYVSEGGKSKGMASAKRIVPAKIKKETRDKIEAYSQKFFAEIGGTGLARLDYLLTKDEKKIYFNEINTMPGSLAFYLWKEVGVSFDKLLDKLIDLAVERHEEKKKLTTTFKSNILEGFSGAKGSKLKA